VIRNRQSKRSASTLRGPEKSPSGINGVDDILGGGLPKGRPTLVCGGAGCGKTLFAIEFLVRGATEHNEPGVFMAFEETEEDLVKNVASLGFNLARLVAQKKVAIDHVHVERSEISETGEYDLEGLFIRLGHAIDSIGARRVVLDTIEALFAGLPNEAVLRSELRRLFSWLKQKGVTAVITGERGQGSLTRYGLEEYVADCVIVLDHRIINQVSTRRLRVVKYRGSLHGTNEYPFLINTDGISALPITTMGLEHGAPTQRLSTGVPRLDTMLGGKGYYRGSSVLVSGTAGTGKTTLAAAFVSAACARGERSLYFAFEESREQIIRNMRSVGTDLASCADTGLLKFHAVRPTIYGLEMHLVAIHDQVRKFKPRIVVLDPLTNLAAIGDDSEVKSMLTRLLDFFKGQQITSLFTTLVAGDSPIEDSQVGISSLIDTWISLTNLERSGERNRALYILKSRGMPHSNQVREFRLSKQGIDLIDVYTGSGMVLTGSARTAQEAQDRADVLARKQHIERLRREISRKKQAAQAQMAMLQASVESDLEELNESLRQELLRTEQDVSERYLLATHRMADKSASTNQASGRRSNSSRLRNPPAAPPNRRSVLDKRNSR
jgi:circadian clock protein KaiC